MPGQISLPKRWREIKTARWLGQGEKELLHPGDLCLGEGLVRFNLEALAHAGHHDLEPGPIERFARRCELRDDVLAVTPLFDHPHDAADLSLDPAQATERVFHNGWFDVHV